MSGCLESPRRLIFAIDGESSDYQPGTGHGGDTARRKPTAIAHDDPDIVGKGLQTYDGVPG